MGRTYLDLLVDSLSLSLSCLKCTSLCSAVSQALSLSLYAVLSPLLFAQLFRGVGRIFERGVTLACQYKGVGVEVVYSSFCQGQTISLASTLTIHFYCTCTLCSFT